MYPDYREDHLRKQMRQRYNKRFFLAVHVGTLIAGALMTEVLPGLQIVVVIGLLALIPHLIYVAYSEYRHWLERKIDREIIHSDSYNDVHPGNKRKRYPEDMTPSKRFRLTDDGEIEAYSAPNSGYINTDATMSDRGTSQYKPSEDRKRRSQKYDKKPRRKSDDTDEFDVKDLLKKVKKFLD